MTLRCPICRQPTDSEKNPEFPFCSERCRRFDLGNWASEKYRVRQPIFDESELPRAPISRTGEAPGAGRASDPHEERDRKSRMP